MSYLRAAEMHRQSLTLSIVLRNPFMFILILFMGGGTYVAYTLNLLGPMMQMGNAALNQAVEIGKQKLREFLENNETARQAIAMPARGADKDRDSINLDKVEQPGEEGHFGPAEDDDF